METSKKHWNKVYETTIPEKTGWYQDSAQQSLDLIAKCNLSKDAHILNVGTGSSNFVNELLDAGFTNITVNDIAASALNVLQSRIPKEQQSSVTFLEDDLTNPILLKEIPEVEVWHDRAVLHFFQKEEEQNAYFELLKNKVKSGGYVIIAVFNLEGALKCSGQELKRYNTQMIQEKLGVEFKLIHHFEFTFLNPNGGERPYIYTLFQRE